MSSNQLVSSMKTSNVHKSRNILLDQLSRQGYDIEDYNGFSINDIHAMILSKQLDMLLTNKETGRKVYVKYLIESKVRREDLDETIEDLYNIENVLTKADTLIFILNEEPNDTTMKKIKYLFDNNGIFTVPINIKRLLYNVLDHILVPVHRILSEDETEKLKVKYNLRGLQDLPQISRFDPVSLAIFIRPGQVCHIVHDSPTAVYTDFYRVCV
jgi:DNA-directed RNA polymerase subunit H (RpoH/RPB5)